MQRTYFTTAEEANDTWRKFFAKLNSLANDHPFLIRFRQREKINPNYTFTPEQEAKLTKYQKKWRGRLQRDKLIKVYSEGIHSGLFRSFINNKKDFPVRKSVNLIKRNQLLDLIQQNNFLPGLMQANHMAKILFADPYFAEIVLGLFPAEKIDFQQLSTLLELNQNLNHGSKFRKNLHVLRENKLILQSVYPILNDKNEFTAEAENILLTTIKSKDPSTLLNIHQIEEFRLLVAALPKSEQYFYVLTGKDKSTFLLTSYLLPIVGYQYKDAMLGFTCGVRNAYGLACFGFEDYMPMVFRLHRQLMKDIEEGEKKGVRWGAMHYPNTFPYNDIHNWKAVTPFLASRHDEYHSRVISSIPKRFLNAFWYIVEMTREVTKFNYSREIWCLIDAEFPYFRDHETKEEDPKSKTQLFLETLKNSNKNHVAIIHGEHNILSIVGIIMLLDMRKNMDIWINRFDIYPQYLNPYWEQLNEIYPEIINDSLKIQILKCQLYFEIINNPSLSFTIEFKILNKIIEYESISDDQLQFQKIPSDKKYYHKTDYTNCLQFDNKTMKRLEIRIKELATKKPTMIESSSIFLDKPIITPDNSAIEQSIQQKSEQNLRDWRKRSGLLS